MKFLALPLLLISFWLFLLISKETKLMELRLQLPKKEKEYLGLLEEERHLQLELDKKLTPPKLLELLRTPRYSHLTFPENVE